MARGWPRRRWRTASEGGDAEHLGEDIVGQAAAHRRDRSGACVPLPDRCRTGAANGRVERRLGRVHSPPDHLDVGRVLRDVRFDFGDDLVDALRLDQADVALGEGLVRQDRLRARAAIAAVQAVDRQGRPGRQALGSRARRRQSKRARSSSRITASRSTGRGRERGSF